MNETINYYENFNSELHTQILNVEELNRPQRDKIISIYRKVYENEHLFNDQEMFHEITKIQILTHSDQIIACSSFVNDRITWLGVDPKLSGNNLGVKLFEQIKIKNPSSWITIGLDYQHVRKAAIKGGFKPIRQEDELKKLFYSVGKNPNESVFHSLIYSEKYAVKGSITFSKLPGKVNNFGHGNDYIQLPLKAN
jgi:hypothetical protein